MKTRNILLLFIFLLGLNLPGYGQTTKMTGTVVSFNKFPLKNITVKAKKAKTETVTNSEGKFELEVNKKDVLIINESSFFEYSKKISGTEEPLTINLIVKTEKKDMEQAVEKEQISREDLDYGIQKLFYANNIYNQFNNVYDAIKYSVPEATIIVENGQKGIQLRGPKTFHGSNLALMIVNGVIVTDVDFITPGDITNIKRLSSSQAALFGSRAGNGVISIETR